MSILSTANSKVGCPYIWGARGSLCTPEYRKKMISNYPNYAKQNKEQCPVVGGSATTCEGCRWYDNERHEARQAFDCAGLCNYVFKQNGITIGQGATTIWNNTKWKSRGPVTSMFPYNDVCLVFRGDKSVKEHIGIYDGEGYVIEAANFNLGVVRRIFDSTKWNYWMIPVGVSDMPFEPYEARVKTNHDGYICLWDSNKKTSYYTKIYDGEVVTVLTAPDAKGFVECTFGLLKGYCDSQYLVRVNSNTNTVGKLEEAIKILHEVVDTLKQE